MQFKDIIGHDENNRLTCVSISNKKESELKEPQNNTTPVYRYAVIRDSYGENVAKNVAKLLEKAIKESGDVKGTTVSKLAKFPIDDDLIKFCQTEKIKEKLDLIRNHAGFIDFVKLKNKSVDELDIKDTLKLIQEYITSLINKGEKMPSYTKYGRFACKIGEQASQSTVHKKNKQINFESPGIKYFVDVKQFEKDFINDTHDYVINSIKQSDKKLGFPKDGINGPHVQGYIDSVMIAMHFDSHIDNGDGKILLVEDV